MRKLFISLCLLISVLPLSPALAEYVHARDVDSMLAAWDTQRRVYSAMDPTPLPGGLMPIPYGTLILRLNEADVVLLGELHDDPATHRLELDIATALGTYAVFAADYHPVALAMEMFERDVQPALDAYVQPGVDPAGAEQEFLETSRPWSNYAEDYRPLVEWGKAVLEVHASNAPTPISRRVAKEGLEAVLPTLTAEERSWIAETTTAPRDEYWERFLEAMGGGASDASHSAGMGEETLYRYYQAQCLKDDTMAETIAMLREKDTDRQVMHLSGSFHIDYGLGIVPRLRERRPDDKIVTVAIRPVEDIDNADLSEFEGLADYVVLVPAPSAVETEAEPAAEAAH